MIQFCLPDCLIIYNVRFEDYKPLKAENSSCSGKDYIILPTSILIYRLSNMVELNEQFIIHID